MKAKKLTERQQELLGYMKQSDTDEQVAVFGKDEIISDWASLKKVMVALGGKWERKAGGFRFEDHVDVWEMLKLARESGEIMDPNEFEFFPTPPELCSRVMELADLVNGKAARVLEPSAGVGALCMAVHVLQPQAHITCVEAFPPNVEKLLYKRYEVIEGDFLKMHPDELGMFDRIVMNPPFSKRKDIQHVSHAMRFLAPGGKLVAIMSAGVKFREDRIGKQFREMVSLHCGTIEENPAGSFKSSGTMVNTVTVTMEGPF